MTAPYLDRVLAAFPGHRRSGDGWVAHCPSPTHGADGCDHSASLRLTVTSGGVLLVKCRVGCPTASVLLAAGLTMQDLYPPPGQPHAEPLTHASIVTTTSDDHALWHRVYAETLSHLRLSVTDERDLRRRGFDIATIEKNQYRTFTTQHRAPLCAKLFPLHGDALYDVPGFIESKHGTPTIADHTDGLLVPVRNLDGKLVALKTRRWSGNVKYLYWSSAKRGGPSPGAPVHVPLHDPSPTSSMRGETVRVTEGELKADLATHLTGLLTLSVPGVSQWRSVFPLLAELKPRRVLVAWDWRDVEKNPEVARSLDEFVRELHRQGYEPGVEHWEDETGVAKGIDDALHHQRPIQQTWGKGALDLARHHWQFLSGQETLSPAVSAPPPTPVSEWVPPPFPVEVFPQPIRDFFTTTARIMQVPVDYCAAPALVVLGRAVGSTRQLALEGDWVEGSNLYLALVAPSGSAKSPAVAKIMKPLRDRQRQELARHERKGNEYKRAMKKWKEECRLARKGGTPPPDEPHRPEPLTHYYCGDVTVEAISTRLQSNLAAPRHDSALLLYMDEILQWIESMNRYHGGKGIDRQFFLSAHSGTPIKVDRKTEDQTVAIDFASVSVLGTIQPDMLPGLADPQGREDGFLFRILFSFPSSVPTPRPTRETIPEDLRLAWDRVVGRLFCLQPAERTVGPENDQDTFYEPVPVNLSEEAWVEWERWGNDLADEMDDPHFPRRLRSPWAKFRGAMGRLTLLLHYAEMACLTCGDGPPPPADVSAQTVRNAAALVAYFQAHFQGVLAALPVTTQDRRVLDFLDWVRAQGGKVSLRRLYHKKLFECKGKADALKLCGLAVDRGLGSLVVDRDTAGRPREIFILQREEEE